MLGPLRLSPGRLRLGQRRDEQGCRQSGGSGKDLDVLHGAQLAEGRIRAGNAAVSPGPARTVARSPWARRSCVVGAGLYPRESRSFDRRRSTRAGGVSATAPHRTLSDHTPPRAMIDSRTGAAPRSCTAPLARRSPRPAGGSGITSLRCRWLRARRRSFVRLWVRWWWRAGARRAAGWCRLVWGIGETAAEKGAGVRAARQHDHRRGGALQYLPVRKVENRTPRGLVERARGCSEPALAQPCRPFRARGLFHPPPSAACCSSTLSPERA
jgi:hypothetical protein